MKNLIKQYVDSNKLSWSPTTQKSELARLMALAPQLDGDPETLWAALQVYKPYTRITTWTRVVAFWDWCGKKSNPYRQWRKTHSRLFKNAYTKERLDITYEEAEKRIETIMDQRIRNTAIDILKSAQRSSEALTHRAPDGMVIGKGNKRRPDFRPELSGPSYDGPYITFYRALKKVGLKPHTLRKLALTRLVDKGATAYDLMEVAGWSSVQTASSYIQPKNIDRLKKLMTAD
jgi:integrase